MSKHGMLSSVARRVRNVGIQLKDQFIENYTVDGVIKSDLELHFNDNEINTFKLKVGSNWQFKLGRFPEIENIGFEIYSDGKVIKYKSNDQLKELFYNGLMFEKYAFNRRLFVCREGANWLFFRSVDINEYLKSNINVRILETGRIKIDLFDQTINKYLAVFTCEYRSESHKRSFVFGAHGGNAGTKLLQILKNNCDYSIFDLVRAKTI